MLHSRRHAHLRAERRDLRVGDPLAPRVDGVSDGEGARGVGDADDVAGVSLLHRAARVGHHRLHAREGELLTLEPRMLHL
eukprot:scaffold44256_cov30-Phaeocystis_antarctica.AAC.1